MFTGSVPDIAAGAVFTAMLVAACVSDLRTNRIPNRLTAAMAVAGVIFSIASAPLAAGLARGLGGFAIGLAIWLPFWLLGWLGAGDVKMFAGAGAWLGFHATLEAAVVAAIAGGVLSLFWLTRERGLRVAVTSLSASLIAPVIGRGSRMDAPRRRMPYAVALTVGLLAAAWIPGVVF